MKLFKLASKEIWADWSFQKWRWIQEVETVRGVDFSEES